MINAHDYEYLQMHTFFSAEYSQVAEYINVYLYRIETFFDL